MKNRFGYVSNSSSSSFLVPSDASVPYSVTRYELPESIWKAIEKYHFDYDDKPLNLSGVSNRWSLTCMVSDCEEAFATLCEIPGAVTYLEGGEMPYGCYESECEADYVILKSHGEKFYVYANDLTGGHDGDMPEPLWLREKARGIFADKSLNKSQKLVLLEHIFDF